MNQTDVRWKQRFENYLNALKQLESAVETSKQRSLNTLEQQGLIQAFEFTHELAWNTLKDYIQQQGGQILIGSKDTTREAFQKNIISDGDTWMEMIKSRNLTSHTYNLIVANDIVQKILNRYFECFIHLKEKLGPLV